MALEGGEGTGKSTQGRLLAGHLERAGHTVLVTREPGGTPAGAAIRAIVLDPATGLLADRAEALLYAADRAHHVATVVRPTLAEGATVITDRYLDSSLAYQGAGRTLDRDEVERCRSGPPRACSRTSPSSSTSTRRSGWPGPAGRDRLEAEPMDFHRRVREGFLDLAARDPRRYAVIDADRSIAEVAADVTAAVDAALGAVRA